MKISEFLSENFHFSFVKFSVYLNRIVFIMIRPGQANVMKNPYNSLIEEILVSAYTIYNIFFN